MGDSRWQSRLKNKKCTGLALIVGQVQASSRDYQSKHWAKSRDLGQPLWKSSLQHRPTRGMQVARLRRSMWSALGMAPDEPDGWYN
jgi:hypothetical protein